MNKPAENTVTKNDLIVQYRQLGTDMKDLRTQHLKDIEALIKKYKEDKKALQLKRAELLMQIRKPAEDAAEQVAPAEVEAVEEVAEVEAA